MKAAPLIHNKTLPAGATLDVNTRQAPANAAQTMLSTEIWLGRKPTHVSHRAMAAAHLVSRARMGRRRFAGWSTVTSVLVSRDRLLPDRHDAFHFIDEILTGREGFPTMRC